MKRASRSLSLAPSAVRTHAELLLLTRTMSDTPRAWIQMDEGGVDIVEQRNGRPSTASVRLTRDDFIRLARWYFREQRISAATVRKWDRRRRRPPASAGRGA